MRYDPSPYSGEIAYFRAEADGPRSADPESVWRRLARRLQVTSVPGDHLSLLREPVVEALAERFSSCLPSGHGSTGPAHIAAAE
jgi:thioesterase domain-containing protein